MDECFIELIIKNYLPKWKANNVFQKGRPVHHGFTQSGLKFYDGIFTDTKDGTMQPTSFERPGIFHFTLSAPSSVRFCHLLASPLITALTSGLGRRSREDVSCLKGSNSS